MRRITLAAIPVTLELVKVLLPGASLRSSPGHPGLYTELGRQFVYKFLITLTAIVTPLTWAAGTAGAAELVLVERGASRVPIVVAADAPPSARHAAHELAEYIEKTSGARLQIIEGLPDPVPPHAIWVGIQPVVKELFPRVDFDFRHPEETLVAADSNHLVIAGRDRRAGEVWVEHGTANAIYTFIQDYLGVRWLWPGPLGEDVLRRETIALAPFTHRFHPTFLSRDVFIHAERWGVAGDWTRLQRLALDSRQGPAGGHAFTDWWERFHESHPEYFALQPDGTRSGWPDPRTVKLCQSNPAVWAQWLADAEESLRGNPALNYLRASPNDGFSSGICVCENCRAWDRADGPPFRYHYEGTSEDYVAMSDRYVTFWNHLARRLKERFPGRDDLYVRVSAYGPSMTAPLGPGLAENTVLGFVGHFPFTTEEARRTQKEQWLAWRKKAPHMLYRPNLWYWAGGVWGLPEVAMTKTIEDFRFLAENHCIGLVVDSAWEHWATQGPQYYLMAQLAWDPFQDGQAVLEDYYRRGFGPAAGEIRAYWTLMEEARDTFVAQPDLQLGSRGRFVKVGIVRRVYSPELLDRAAALLDRAAARTADAPEVYGKRVAFVRAGLDVTRLMVQTIPVMDRVRESGGRDVEAVRQAAANWARMEEIARQAGPVAFRFSNILSRVRGGYMGGVADYLGPPSEEFKRAAAEAAQESRPGPGAGN